MRCTSASGGSWGSGQAGTNSASPRALNYNMGVPDILAIVSKAIFEKDARVGGKVVATGQLWPVDRYNSANKALQALTAGGRIFLVTVRPPDERLWFVGVVDSPKFEGSAWIAAAPNTIPVTDVTALRKTLVFESGKGMSQDKGALGMSLQTPRTLATSDVEQLLAAAGAATSPMATTGTIAAVTPATATPPAPAVQGPAAALLLALAETPSDELLREKTVRELLEMGATAEARLALTGLALLNAHDPSGLPCVCRRCWELSGPSAEHGGLAFSRDLVVKNGKALFFWAPRELASSAQALRRSVRASIALRLAALAKSRKQHRRARPEF
jgi:hypothetical protein